jgi:hypothetical protein
MHPDADYLGPRDDEDTTSIDSDTYDPYLISAVSASRPPAEQRKLSEAMQVIVDELSATATSRRASLLNRKG